MAAIQMQNGGDDSGVKACKNRMSLLRPPCIFFFYLSLLHPTTLNSYLVSLFSPYLTRLINRNIFRLYYIEATRRA